MSQHNLSRREFLRLVSLSAAALTAPSLLNSVSVAAQESTRMWSMTGQEVSELSIFDREMRNFMQARDIRGGALAITWEGRLVLARGYNWNDDPNEIVQPDSLFRIASISKPFTATAIFQLIEAGEFTLETPVVDLLDLEPPPGRTPDPRLSDVQIVHLLQHLGGWDRALTFDPMFIDQRLIVAVEADYPVTQDDIITYMTGQDLQYDPGTTYAYSNYGYVLLGRVIEEVSGQSYEEYVREHILQPLDITRMQLGHTTLDKRIEGEVRYYNTGQNVRSVIDPSQRGPGAYGSFNIENMDAHGGWVASAIDLVRFSSAFDDPNNCPLLNADSIEQMLAPPINDPEVRGPYYASGWQMAPAIGGRLAGHAGQLPGTATLLQRLPNTLNWAALFNQSNDPSGLDYYVLSGQMAQFARFVRIWPEHDLFGEYLDIS